MWMKQLKGCLFHTCVQPQHWRWIWTSESCIWPKTSWTVCRTRLSWGICWSSTTTSRFWTWETITYWTQVWPQISSVSWLLVSCFSNACTCLQPAVFAFARFLRVGIYMWGSEGAEEGFGHSGALEQPAHTQWNGIPGRRFGKHTHTHTHAQLCHKSFHEQIHIFRAYSNQEQHNKAKRIANGFCPKTIHTNYSTQICL